MKRQSLTTGVAILLAAGSGDASRAAEPPPAAPQPPAVETPGRVHREVLDRYCVTCHNARMVRVPNKTEGADLRAGKTVDQYAAHDQTDAHSVAQYTKVNVYHLSLFARFVEKLRATPDGDGTLLDHSMLLYGCGMGDGDHHTPFDLPVALVGGGAGRLAGNRHLRYPLHTPFMNLGLALLEKVDVRVDSIADSTGRLAGV